MSSEVEGHRMFEDPVVQAALQESNDDPWHLARVLWEDLEQTVQHWKEEYLRAASTGIQ